MRAMQRQTEATMSKVVPILPLDRQLECDIAFARERMYSFFRAGNTDLARVWFAHMQKLIASRSAAQVDGIERDNGLAA
jgi:hypothetical protein